METTTDDHSKPPADHSTGEDQSKPPADHSTGVDHQENILPPDTASDVVMDCKQETGDEEERKILEIMAATGEFWLEWEELKSLLSRQLKKVLSEYPEGKMSLKEQISILREPYEELVNKFDEALCSFIDGPPFTLQRLCEIILGAKDIYPKLYKLGLALEKNLLVTSTLTISTDPYPLPATKKSEVVEKIEEPQPQSKPIQNGAEHVTTGENEVKVEAANSNGEGNDDMKVDEVSEEKSDDMKVDEVSEEKSEQTTPDPTPTTETKPVDSQSL